MQMTRLLLCTGLLAALLLGCQSIDVEDLPALIAETRPAVATISDGTTSTGSAFVIDPSGLLVTNDHVLSDTAVLVTLADGRTLTARILIRDPDADLAIIAVTASGLPALPLRTTEPLVGETVVALGNPFGLGITASRGIVSARGQAIGNALRLQTDAAINPGNSGGPLIDRNGNAIGVVNARTALGHGVGLVIPAAHIVELLGRMDTTSGDSQRR